MVRVTMEATRGIQMADRGGIADNLNILFHLCFHLTTWFIQEEENTKRFHIYLHLCQVHNVLLQLPLLAFWSPTSWGWSLRCP